MTDFLNATPGSCLDEWNHSPEKQVKILIGFAGLSILHEPTPVCNEHDRRCI